MPAVDALVVRTALHEQMQNPKFVRLMDTYARLESKGNNYDLHSAIQLFGGGAFKTALDFAENFYLGPDMFQLAMRAAEDFPLDETIMKEDQPSDGGFMLIPSRFRMFELRGRLCVVHACVWLQNKVWLLTDRHDPEDEISAEMRAEAADYEADVRSLGRYDVCGVMRFVYGKPIPRSVSFAKSVLPPEAKVSFARQDGSVVLFTDHVIDNTQAPTPKPDPFLMFLLATWRLMQQTLASLHQEEMPRHARRRADRYHAPTGVTVIQLRRREGEYEGTGQSINYRYLRRGHWRRVWCGPMKGERYQRAVYIHPQICGPKDAPLIIRERVNALVR